VKIIFDGFDGTNIEQQRKPFKDLIGQLAQGLKLKSLEYIIIPKDFETQLYMFQRSKGLREECTDNETVVTIGKNINYVEVEELKTSIFLHPSIIQNLSSESIDDVLGAIHTIKHELCHSHDTYLKSKIISLDFIIDKEGDFDWVLKLHADSIWSEYIANKLSKSIINKNGNELVMPTEAVLEQDISMLLASIFEVETDVHKYIDRYRKHQDIMRLYLEIQESSGFLLKMMSAVYGSLCCCEDAIKSLDIEIKGTCVFEIWKSLCQSLDNLNSNYPNWSGIQEFDELSQVVLETWNILGIFPRVAGSNLFIDVPSK
jgi:hypothetical protein